MRAFFGAFAALSCSLVTPLGELQVPDSSTLPDSPSDGTPMEASNDAGTAFCPTHPHSFCADFDDGTVMWGFDDISMGGTSTVKLDLVDFVSKPASFQSSMMMHTAAMYEDALVRKQVPSKNRYHFEIDFQLCATPFDGTHVFGLLQYTGTDPFRVNVNGAGVLSLAVETTDGGATAKYGLGSVTAGWHRMIVDTADTTATGGSVLRVWIDGAMMVDQKPGATWAGMETMLVVGVTAFMAVPTCTMRFDNVALDY